MQRLGQESMEHLFVTVTQYKQRRLFALEQVRDERMGDQEYLTLLSNAFRTMATALVDQYRADEANAKRQIRSVTLINSQGIPQPTFSNILAELLQLDQNTVPFFHITGVNCAGSFHALQHIYNLRKDAPLEEGERDLVFAVEVPSITLRRGRSFAELLYLISDAVISDGAALAVVESTRERKGLQLLGHLSLTFPKFAHYLPSKFDGEQIQYGLHPEFVDNLSPVLRLAVDRGIEHVGLTKEQINRWVVHPGGITVVQCLKNTMGLPDGDLDVEIGLDTIRSQGNTMSSLFLYNLKNYFNRGAFKEGDLAMLVGIAPGVEIGTLAARYQ